jgi:hypothetical protein
VNIKILAVAALLAAASLSAACSGADPNANQTANNNGAVPVAQDGSNPTTAPGNVPTGPDPTRDVTPSPNVHPAADNSEITVEMDKTTGDVLETRTFKDNKNVSKIVVVTSTKSGKMTKTATVYDRNGKAHSVPESKLGSIMQDTGDAIAGLAGIAVEKTKDVAGETRDTAGKVAGKTKDVSKSAADKAKEGVDAIKKKVP